MRGGTYAGANDMPLPPYDDLADALASFVLLNGGEAHCVRAEETYDPLADFFGLTLQERTRPRPDGYGGTDWQNKVQSGHDSD